ncbi:MAG: histidine kinase [Eubacteriales bacterium]|nr:histidine kinase [Eubacteriales bacterium]
MSFLIDKIILILLSFLVLIQSYDGISTVVVLLALISISAFISLTENKWCTLGSSLLLGVLIFYEPICLWMIPVVLYDIYTYRLVSPLVLYALGGMYASNTVPVTQLLSICILGVLSVRMCYKTTQTEKLSVKVRRIRDDEEEKKRLLEEKNKNLMIRQDQEVYVATLKERNRIAREIHDNVGHILTRTILQMGALMTIHKEEPLHGQLTSVKENLDVAMNNVRESVHDLHDESVDMKQAIAEILQDLDKHFTVKYSYDLSQHVDKNVKYAFIGIVREAVSNIIKHSKNDYVDVILREHPGMYQLVVHDYSKLTTQKKQWDQYFDKVSKTGGIGLQNIGDRVRGLNGNLTIDTQNGYRIFVTVPKERGGYICE